MQHTPEGCRLFFWVHGISLWLRGRNLGSTSFGCCRLRTIMSDMSFLTTVKAKSFLHTVIMSISGELTILAQLVRDWVLRLILRGAFRGFGGWWWWAIIVAQRAGRCFERGVIGIGGFVRIFLTQVSIISRASGFEMRFFLLHPVDVVSILGFEVQGH